MTEWHNLHSSPGLTQQSQKYYFFDKCSGSSERIILKIRVFSCEMATLQTNPMHEELGDADYDDEPISDLRAGPGILGTGSSARPASLPVTRGDTEDIAPSWTGGLTQGCAPVFQPFGSPSKSHNIQIPNIWGSGYRVQGVPGPSVISKKAGRLDVFWIIQEISFKKKELITLFRTPCTYRI